MRFESVMEFERDTNPPVTPAQWRNFTNVINKAKEACANAGQQVSDHFADVSKMVSIGSGAGRDVENFMLTRYACYLVARNSSREPSCCRGCQEGRASLGQ